MSAPGSRLASVEELQRATVRRSPGPGNPAPHPGTTRHPPGTHPATRQPGNPATRNWTHVVLAWKPPGTRHPAHPAHPAPPGTYPATRHPNPAPTRQPGNQGSTVRVFVHAIVPCRLASALPVSFDGVVIPRLMTAPAPGPARTPACCSRRWRARPPLVLGTAPAARHAACTAADPPPRPGAIGLGRGVGVGSASATASSTMGAPSVDATPTRLTAPSAGLAAQRGAQRARIIIQSVACDQKKAVVLRVHQNNPIPD